MTERIVGHLPWVVLDSHTRKLGFLDCCGLRRNVPTGSHVEQLAPTDGAIFGGRT